LTVVAFGTSAPELSVSVIAAVSGSPDLTTGNIVGSNIANIGLVLGAGAIFTPVCSNRGLLVVEFPFLVFSGCLAWLFSYGGMINRIEGMILLAMFCGYLWFVFFKKKVDGDEIDELRPASDVSMRRLVFYVCAGVAGLVGGSKLIVWGAVFLARYAGVSELVIGLSLTAIGTSLPELAATVVAARKGHGDIALGNVIGSNLANICGVLGPVAIISPVAVNKNVVLRDFPVMLVFTIFLYTCFFVGGCIWRKVAMLLIAGYVSYLLAISGIV
jgi:cation:H+ antiporter